MSKKINRENLHTQYVRVTEETKNKLAKVSFNLKIPECHIADDILCSHISDYKPLSINKENNDTDKYLARAASRQSRKFATRRSQDSSGKRNQ